MDDLERRAVLGVAGLAGVAALSRLAHAGPLSPPAGAVGSTAKPLTEVEPRTAINNTNTPGVGLAVYTIAQSGSYYLTGNVAVTGVQSGITVTADDVTIDLMGFTIRGTSGVTDGIRAESGPRNRITIRNGRISGCLNGINLTAAGPGTGVHIEGVQVNNIVGAGISVPNGAVVLDCEVFGCGAQGIIGVDNCVVQGCVARGNTGIGISLGVSAVVRGCTSNGNARGIAAGAGAHVEGCSASSNAAHGVEVSSGVIVQCSANANGAIGIILNAGTVMGCAASNNTGTGISAGTGCVVANCGATSNSGSGIQAYNGCVILNNTCVGNGAGNVNLAGIYVQDADNRIEGNNVTANSNGIKVFAGGNLILRNAASGSTANNYDIVTNNRYGPVVNITAAGTAAVTGNVAASTLTSTDANANYAY